MTARNIATTAAAAATLALLVRTAAVAQPTTAPTTVPSIAGISDADPRPTAELEAAAYAAFDAGDYAAALPMLKNLSIRLRGDTDRVQPILEKVRVAERQLGQAVEGINAPRTPHAKSTDASKPYELTLQKLGNFEYDPERGGGIPDDVNSLNGSTIKITGFMIPIDESDKITKFVLVPDLFGCCFGQPPQVQHTAIVVCPPGKAVTYFPDEISIVGTLKVAEQKDGGYVTSIFEVTADSIRPASR